MGNQRSATSRSLPMRFLCSLIRRPVRLLTDHAGRWCCRIGLDVRHQTGNKSPPRACSLPRCVPASPVPTGGGRILPCRALSSPQGQVYGRDSSIAIKQEQDHAPDGFYLLLHCQCLLQCSMQRYSGTPTTYRAQKKIDIGIGLIFRGKKSVFPLGLSPTPPRRKADTTACAGHCGSIGGTGVSGHNVHRCHRSQHPHRCCRPAPAPFPSRTSPPGLCLPALPNPAMKAGPPAADVPRGAEPGRPLRRPKRRSNSTTAVFVRRGTPAPVRVL